MRAKISMIAVNMTAYPSVRKPALDAPEPVELEFARDRSRRFGFPSTRSTAQQRSIARQYDWSQSLAHAGINQRRGFRTAGKKKSPCATIDDRGVRLVGV